MIHLNYCRGKELINSALKKKKLSLYISIFILIVVVILFINFILNIKKTVIKHKQIAQDLIHSIENKNQTIIETKEQYLMYFVEIENESKTNKIISRRYLFSILKELEILKQKNFS